jgi:transposase
MLHVVEEAEVFLHREPVDFRKQINGLAVLVQEEMALNVMRQALFVFTNRRCDRIKALYWDRTGFCLWLKRLEKERFKWPLAHEDDVITLTGEQLNWLLSGFDIFRFPPH